MRTMGTAAVAVHGVHRASAGNTSARLEASFEFENQVEVFEFVKERLRTADRRARNPPSQDRIEVLEKFIEVYAFLTHPSTFP